MPEKRTGVFVCSCGPNIGDRIDIEAVAEEMSKIPDVVLSETYGLLCSPAGKKYLEEKIREHSLDRVVIAACSPREHEETFMKVCEKAGLNPFMMEMANIREQVAWVTADRELATEKALKLVRGAVFRTERHRPLEKTSIVCNPDVAVIGGGASGMTAALALANTGRTVTILERNSSLGGGLSEHEGEFVDALIKKVRDNKGIRIFTDTELKEIVGFFGNFIIETESDRLEVGSIVMATGSEVDPRGNVTPASGFSGLAEQLRISTDENGFPEREHDSLAPVSTPIDGVYITGCAGGPCSVFEGTARSEAVAGTILSTLIPGREVETEARTSVISETLCRGCRMCMEVCGYGAISYSEEKMVCQVNGILCKGCGNCAAACPSGAIRAQHFTPDQLRYQLSGVLK